MLNKYKIKLKLFWFKQQCITWSIKIFLILKQIFIPLAIIQLIRTILFPTPLDVILLLIFFIIIVCLLIKWI
jgi:hypothetical protein